ncbi:hypothetical protein LSAT2_021004, partial [Lamellibrachia satsuma]
QRPATVTAAGDSATVKATAVTVIVPMLDGPNVKSIVSLGTNVGLIVEEAAAQTLEVESTAAALVVNASYANANYGIRRRRRYRASIERIA